MTCSSGQRVIRCADKVYAFLGEPVHELTSPLADDPDYRAMFVRCTA